jgi:predicted transcriptional regulator
LEVFMAVFKVFVVLKPLNHQNWQNQQNHVNIMTNIIHTIPKENLSSYQLLVQALHNILQISSKNFWLNSCTLYFIMSSNYNNTTEIQYNIAKVIRNGAI